MKRCPAQYWKKKKKKMVKTLTRNVNTNICLRDIRRDGASLEAIRGRKRKRQGKYTYQPPLSSPHTHCHHYPTLPAHPPVINALLDYFNNYHLLEFKCYHQEDLHHSYVCSVRTLTVTDTTLLNFSDLSTNYYGEKHNFDADVMFFLAN